MRDVIANLRGFAERSNALNGSFQEDGCGCAVDIVVAVDKDGLAYRDGSLDPSDGPDMPSIRSGEWRSSRVGLRKRCGSLTLRDASRRAIGSGQESAA